MFVKNGKSLVGMGVDKKEQENIAFLLKVIEKTLVFAQPEYFLKTGIKLCKKSLVVQGEEFNLDTYRNFYLIAFGKASLSMTKWFLNAFPHNFSEIIVVSANGCDKNWQIPDHCTFIKAGHPIPDKRSEIAANKIIELLETLGQADLCIFLISGGGSALVESLEFGLELEDFNKLTKQLLSCGATIHEINTIRKHFSEIKGGKLVRHTSANIISFIVSDVIGNNPAFVASGPTVQDNTTWNHCLSILSKYNLNRNLPLKIQQILSDPILLTKTETPKESEIFAKVSNYVVGDNKLLLSKLKHYLDKHIVTHVRDTKIQGEASEIGKKLAKEALKIEKQKSRQIMLYGGETTVNLGVSNFIGVGGRNQELALSFFIELGINNNIYFVQLATDGKDGTSNAAGALIAPFLRSKQNLARSALDALKNHDSNTFFHKNGGEIITDHTGTNLMDITILLINGEKR